MGLRQKAKAPPPHRLPSRFVPCPFADKALAKKARRFGLRAPTTSRRWGETAARLPLPLARCAHGKALSRCRALRPFPPRGLRPLPPSFPQSGCRAALKKLWLADGSPHCGMGGLPLRSPANAFSLRPRPPETALRCGKKRRRCRSPPAPCRLLAQTAPLALGLRGVRFGFALRLRRMAYASPCPEMQKAKQTTRDAATQFQRTPPSSKIHRSQTQRYRPEREIRNRKRARYRVPTAKSRTPLPCRPYCPAE